MKNRALVPPPLEKGDTLGVVAPAGMLGDESLFYAGVQILREMGFEVKFPRNLWPGMGYLADCDDNRAFEINSLFKDSEVKGLISMRGGYGCLRILDQIDLGVVGANPKFLLGFSDISVLQNYLHGATGLVSLHGPVLTSLASLEKESLERLYHSLTGKWASSIENKKIEILQGNSSTDGILVGGNLASIVTLVGTKYDISWENKLVFLEDVNEPIYKIDRMLTQLAAAGKFTGVAGILLGCFTPPRNLSHVDRLRYKESIWQRVVELVSDSAIPVWGNLPSGHSTQNLTFPIGAHATMDYSGFRLLFT